MSSEISISFRTYKRPFRKPLLTAHGEWKEREGIIVRLEDVRGQVGFGEIAPIPWFGTETMEDAIELLEGLGSAFNLKEIDGIPNSLPCCQFALEAAFMGLSEEKEEISSFSTEVGALLSLDDGFEEVVEQKLKNGYRSFKVKISVHSIEKELSLIRRLARLLPGDGSIRLDANGGLSLSDTRILLKKVEGLPIEFLEQPFPPDKREDLLALAKDSMVPIALDESVVKVDDLKRWRDLHWPGVYVLKPGLAGRVTELKRELNQGLGDFVFSSALETVVGIKEALKLAAGFESKRPLGFGVESLFEDNWMFEARPVIDDTFIKNMEGAKIWEMC
jgi:O-succinylbenzoate synthase